MRIARWSDIPTLMRNNEVFKYHKLLGQKQTVLHVKRILDLMLSLILLPIIIPMLILIGICIKMDSKGPILFKQIRITQYGKEFKILKFRTMVSNHEVQITSLNDNCITKAGATLRKYRLDELPQVFNILKGEMTFVGTRPEVPRYVKEYTDEMLATLLLPAGVTSYASIKFRNEDSLLQGCIDVEQEYIRHILPQKMRYNLEAIRNLSIQNDFKVLLSTLIHVFR